MPQHLRSNDPRGPRQASTRTTRSARPAAGATTRRVSSRTAARTSQVAQARRSGRAATPGPSHGSRVTVLVVLGLLAVAALVVALVVGRCSASAPAQGSDAPAATPTGTVELKVPEGATGDQIAQAVVDAGLSPDLKTFYSTVTRLKADASLKPGTYEFAPGTSVEDVVRQLMQGPNSSKGRLTVAEGLTVAKTAEVVEQSLGIPQADFLAQAKASNYVADYPFLEPAADDSLEGFLWGSTYDFTGKEVTADTVIRAMLDQYAQQTASIDFDSGRSAIADAYGVQMSDYDILKLASIIERETPTDKDRPLVASVSYNRLKIDMPLQVDATTEYVVGREVTPDDLKQDNAYNTYLHKGLPPTPICTPSLACIEAALGPADTNYLYFLIIENGSYSNHTFSATYEEHLAAIEKAKADQAQ